MYFLKKEDFRYFKKTFNYLDNYQRGINYDLKREYRWSKNPLKEWSRCCEYPFLYESIKKCNSRKKNILDFGSGKNFLPILLSSEGHNVTCVDIDDYSSFYKYYSSKENEIIFSSKIDEVENNFDLIYSISVLEHTKNVVENLNLLTQKLKKGGKLILTFDIDVRGDLSISMDKLYSIFNFLGQNFTSEKLKFSDSNYLLTFNNSPYGLRNRTLTFKLKRSLAAMYDTIFHSRNRSKWFELYSLRVGLYLGTKK